MRVLVVTNVFPPLVRGGYEVECATVVDGLRALGHDVHVLTSRPVDAGGDERVHPVLALLSVDARGALAAPAAAVRGAAAARRVRVAVRPDLVYVWNAVQLPWSALHVLADGATPLAFRLCEHWFGRLPRAGDQFLRYLEPAGPGSTAAWRALCRGVAAAGRVPAGPRPGTTASLSWVSAYLRDATPVPPDLAVVEEEVLHPVSPVAEVLAGAPAPATPPDGPPEVLFAGRLSAEKGAEVAVRALAILHDAHGIDARLVVAGPAEAHEREALLAVARAAGVEGAVELTGRLEAAALAARARRASAWVVPSTWDEPAGLTCIEAAVAGVPVVAARVGGIPELLADGREALLFERSDAADCARALAATLGAPDAARRAAAARERWRGWTVERYVGAQAAFVERAAGR